MQESSFRSQVHSKRNIMYSMIVLVKIVVAFLLASGWSAQALNTASSAVDDGSSFKTAGGNPVINADCARPLRLRPTAPRGVSIPRLQNAQQKPNFIVILTDDQGFDDMGLHNPKYVQTPNLDKFLRGSTLFDNFYVQPECAQTRAELLTGRSYPRTSTMLVHGGYDFIHPDEVNIGEFFRDAGYLTAQIGKWHEYDIAGYGPAEVGFEKTWQSVNMSPDSSECLLSYNGLYAETVSSPAADDDESKKHPRGVPRPDPTPGTLTAETALVNKIMSFLRNYALQRKNEEENRPMLLLYTPRLIHKKEGLKGQLRAYPPSYRKRLLKDPKYHGISTETLDAWATLAYLDDLLGNVFDTLDNTTLKDDTYVFLMSDNGASMSREELSTVQRRQTRLPSSMQGSKSTIFEGGIRGFLAVRGPGVRGGVTDSTLLQITDILPTLADLAGVRKDAHHLPWDGMSFKNLLLWEPNNPLSRGLLGRRGSRLSNQSQRERFVFALGPACWDADAILELGPGREVVRPQPLLDYDRGGMLNTGGGKTAYMDQLSPVPVDQANPGFEPCIVVRHKDYKWSGLTKKVHRLVNGNHVELPCNEVTGPEARNMANIMSRAARNWWKSLATEPHSFVKPTFYLGLPSWVVSNINAEAAHERTKGHIALNPRGATGFQYPGDRMCWKIQVLTPASYQVLVLYQSALAATFKFSLGPYLDIAAGTSKRMIRLLPASDHLKGWATGRFNDVPVTKPGVKTELCLELVDTPAAGTPVMQYLAALRIVQLTNTAQHDQALSYGANNFTSSGWQTAAEAGSELEAVSTENAAAIAGKPGFPAIAAVPAPEPNLGELAKWLPLVKGAQPAGKEPPSSTEHDVMFGERHSTDAGTGDAASAAAAQWQQLQTACGWPAGQGILQNMYTPYVEGLEECDDCLPNL